MFRLIAACSLLIGMNCFAEDAEAVYQQGVAQLRLAQADHAALVPATRLLAKAAALFEANGDENKSAEVNSCLYWAKKKMTLADTQAVKGNEEVSKRLEATAKEIPVSEAEAMLKRADTFAQGHADDPLLIAIRYYEVGDRFKDSEFGRKAIDSSLKYMQQVGEKAKLAEYKPAATDGKAFITSDPPGAAIILVDANGRQDLTKKTPSLIQLPKGKQTLQLEKDGMKPTVLEVVIGDGITKPESVKMDAVTYAVDVLFEDGWQVFVDGKPVSDSAGKKAVTPCTIEAPRGKHTLLLAREGFQDLSQPIEVKEQTTIELKQKPLKGVSTLLKSGAKPVAIEGANKSDPAKIIVKKCEYSAGDKKADLTAVVKALLEKDPYVPIEAYGMYKVADPAYGINKILELTYEWNGKMITEKLSTSGYESAAVPRWPKEGVALPDASHVFKIVAARFGAGIAWADVTSQIKAIAKDPSAQFRCPELPDPLFGVNKTLAIWFDYQGRRYCWLGIIGGNGVQVLLLPGK